MASWSSLWKGSKSPRKQRNYLANAPAHVKSRMLGSHLSKDLRSKLKVRSLRVRRGDKVKVLRGQFKGKRGAVDRVSVDDQKVFIVGVELVKRDGSKTLYPVHASNVLIEELEGNDKRRLGERK